MSEKKKVLIIGAGYAGIEAAKLLDSKFDVTVVERKKTFFHCVASVRVAVEPELVPQVYIPYDKLLKNGKFIFSSATEITPNHVTLEDGQTLHFDYLVIATGSNVLAPFKAPLNLTNNRDIQQYFDNFSNQIKQANKILIVGGGSVGVEFAAEVYDKYGKDKKITIVHSGSTLVNDAMAPKFNNMTLKSMEKRNIHLVLNDRIALPESVRESLNSQSALLPTPSTATYTTEKGEQIEADLLIWTVGIKINSEAYTNSHFQNSINQQGQIKVNASLQVEGFKNIFAVGDVTDTKEFKTAFNASTHAKVVAKVIEAVNKNSNKLPTHTPSKPVMILALGKSDGVFQLPNQMVMGSFLSKLLKSKTLFIKKTWEGLGNPKQLNFN
ncbi:hypothetical protein DICPUDRAFT_83476 [Dictyostelium purpureum]|uniref:FAD/NAD(P)-binding domain-containing protein n=1 Tax=Dictyostelium purpureum TaxID=5786 RepID=F0ZZN4_DICPU|nr:uncharacterized protein DICPUDRAFT_83476 [Dictyostelium purpureum]EGC30594.1 hypothetical protein DICPUDRAFT_83476 [Dictyostelium purpureum]|eukprot:XP_003292882.1 hypothetical protein DICPUDRAFT_83476 [Dictyostelium purpureum]